MNAALPIEADDKLVSIDDLIHLRTPSVYLVKVDGDSMQGAGIFSGDLLVVDRLVESKSGDIIIAAVNGEATCKRMVIRESRVVLLADNPKYPSRYILEGDQFEVWGVVTHSIRDHNRRL
ncbi:LexA family protein [Pseudomonas putida]|uniref:LexA family protein n=1 Tax=Pseudomonas putida TaxID=303 RepID=UPI0022DDF41E|nr:S24 family peptidase [Pseudomonas putida]WBM49117.1 S24 family peptidase [Pseudomonas putida]